jgi:hypothetical protein
LKSIPDENIAPSPRMTTQRTPLSCAAAVHGVALVRPVHHDVADRPAVLGQHDVHGDLLGLLAE